MILDTKCHKTNQIILKQVCLWILTGSTVLGLRTSDGLVGLPDVVLGAESPVFFPALAGGVLDPREPADPKELALLALPGCELAMSNLLNCYGRKLASIKLKK